MSDLCPICEAETLTKMEPRQDATYCECPRCLRYALSGTARVLLASAHTHGRFARAKLSHSVYRMASSGQWPKLDSAPVRNILEDPTLPAPAEQLNNLVTYLAGTQADPGSRVHASHAAIAAVGAVDFNGLGYIAQQAVQHGLVDGDVTPVTGLGQDSEDWVIEPLQLTIPGWDRAEALRRGHTTSRIAFMAMPFGIDELDRLYREHFQPAVDTTGFKLKRLDENQPAGLIDDRLRVEIRQCRFLIADLTHRNPGAYWEAGYAEGLGKPVIYTCVRSVFDDRTKGTHFDTNHHLTVIWEAASPATAVTKLKATIRATLPTEAVLSDQ
jgi:hypothetical protein